MLLVLITPPCINWGRVRSNRGRLNGKMRVVDRGKSEEESGIIGVDVSKNYGRLKQNWGRIYGWIVGDWD